MSSIAPHSARDTAYFFTLLAITLVLTFAVMRQSWGPASPPPPSQTAEPTGSDPTPNTPAPQPPQERPPDRPDIPTDNPALADQDLLYLGRPMSQWTARLRHDDPRQRAFALERVGQLGRPALSLLTWALHDPHPTVRITALRALHRLGPDATPATSFLVDLLTTDPVRDVRLLTISCLGQIGPAANQALEPLKAIQRNTDIAMRIAATTAIKKITAPRR